MATKNSIASVLKEGLTSLERSKEERKKSSEICCSPHSEDSGPDYPWGTTLRFDKDTLEKLGIDIADYSVGDKIIIVCETCVTELASTSGKHSESKRMELQVEKMKIAAEEGGEGSDNE